MLTRRVISGALLAGALLLVTATMWGRHAGNAATEAAVQVGQYGEGTPQLGNDDEFEPFAFAVIGPVRGSHAALGRALDHVTSAPGLRSVILLGDVLGEGGDALPLAATLRSFNKPVVAVAGEHDLRRLAQFQRLISAPDWSFRDRGCLFTSWGPGSQGDAERVPADDVAARFLFTTSPKSAPQLAWSDIYSAESHDDDLRVQIVNVGPDEFVESEVLTLSRGPSPRSVFTSLAVGVLYPFSRTMTGLVALLLAAAGMVFVGFRLWSPPLSRPRA